MKRVLQIRVYRSLLAPKEDGISPPSNDRVWMPNSQDHDDEFEEEKQEDDMGVEVKIGRSWVLSYVSWFPKDQTLA